MVSVEQLSALLDFLEDHPALALGRCTRTKEGRSLAKRLWEDCAATLNSVSPDDCVQKTPEQWRVYYNEYKSKLLKKIKNEKQERSATGGQAKEIVLTPLQDRLYYILGRDVGELVPGVCQDPLSQAFSADEGSHDNRSPAFGEDVDQEEDPEFGSEPLAKNKRISKKKRAHKAKADSERETPTGESAERLHKMLNADAMLVHAAAINRLAAAIETLAERIPVAESILPVGTRTINKEAK